MKNKKSNVIILASCFWVVSFFVWGCTGETKEDKGTGVEDVVLSPVRDTVHSTRNSIDYAGTYKGLTPCADCEGIELELTLKMDSTYIHTAKYLGKGVSKSSVKSGKYIWVDGGTIQLEGITDGPSLFKVGEGRIWQLDMQGKMIEGELEEKYILTKTN